MSLFPVGGDVWVESDAMDDWQLLRDYVERRSETAFELLVKRHVDLVYATALRHLRDPHLAKDASQAVFILLARKARSLKSPVILAGWLYRTASHVASRALRKRVRRQHREEEASAMNFNDPARELWGKLEPHLDGAINALNAADRNAVVLRFLQQRSFREVASSLGVSEDAAKKRVNRALDKLRAHFTSHGITVAGAVLGAALTADPAQSAPAPVVAAAISVGVSGAPATAMALTLAGQVARAWLFAKLKWAGAIAGAGALVLLVATHWLPGTPAPSDSAANSNVPTNNAGTPAVAPDEPTPASPVAPPLNPRAMRVKVVSSADGSPLPRAKARVVFYGPKGTVENATAAANGVIEIARPDRTYAGMAYWIAAPGHVPKCLWWKQEEEKFLPADYEVLLDPGVSLSGRVVDESGQPVAGATLRFGEEGMKSNARDYVDYRYPSFVPTSNANGDWSADFLRPRTDGEGIGGYVEHPDYAETAFSFPLASTGASNVTVVIKQGAPVAGRVVGAGGESVPEALVTVDWQYDSCRNEIKTKADATGRFFLAHVTPGPLPP